MAQKLYTLGVDDPFVTDIEHALNIAGLYDLGEEYDTYLGPDCDMGMRAFQAAHGLMADCEAATGGETLKAFGLA